MEQRSTLAFAGSARITGLPLATANGQPLVYEQLGGGAATDSVIVTNGTYDLQSNLTVSNVIIRPTGAVTINLPSLASIISGAREITIYHDQDEVYADAMVSILCNGADEFIVGATGMPFCKAALAQLLPTTSGWKVIAFSQERPITITVPYDMEEASVTIPVKGVNSSSRIKAWFSFFVDETEENPYPVCEQDCILTAYVGAIADEIIFTVRSRNGEGVGGLYRIYYSNYLAFY